MGDDYKLLDSEFLYVSSSGKEPWVTASGDSFITMSSLHAGAKRAKSCENLMKDS